MLNLLVYVFNKYSGFNNDDIDNIDSLDLNINENYMILNYGDITISKYYIANVNFFIRNNGLELLKTFLFLKIKDFDVLDL